MLVTFTVDTAVLDTDTAPVEREALRSAAAYFLHLAGELPEVQNGPADANGQISTLEVKLDPNKVFPTLAAIPPPVITAAAPVPPPPAPVRP